MYYIPGGWPQVFYCFGTIGLVWFFVWMGIVYNDPFSNPFISAEECKYLSETISYVEERKKVSLVCNINVDRFCENLEPFRYSWNLYVFYPKKLSHTPWMSILLAPTVWALVVAEIGFDWCAYTIVNDLPKYMNDVLHFSIKEVRINFNRYKIKLFCCEFQH